MTVRQNIAAAVRDRSLRHTAVEGQLRRFRLEDAAELLPRQISGGQRSPCPGSEFPQCTGG